MKMKNKIILVMLCVLFIIVACMIWNKARTVSMTNLVDTTNVSKIILYSSMGDIVLTEKEDIRAILDIMEQVQLKRTYSGVSEGFAFVVELYYADDAVHRITMKKDYIILEDTYYYKCDRNYCDDVRTFYNQISKE